MAEQVWPQQVLQACYQLYFFFFSRFLLGWFLLGWFLLGLGRAFCRSLSWSLGLRPQTSPPFNVVRYSVTALASASLSPSAGILVSAFIACGFFNHR